MTQTVLTLNACAPRNLFNLLFHFPSVIAEVLFLFNRTSPEASPLYFLFPLLFPFSPSGYVSCSRGHSLLWRGRCLVLVITAPNEAGYISISGTSRTYRAGLLLSHQPLWCKLSAITLANFV